LRTLAAILIFALPAGWAAFAATESGTDSKTAPKKSTAKKTTSTKAPTGKTSISSKTSVTKPATTNSINTKTGTSKATVSKSGTTKTGVSNFKQTASKTGTKTGTAASNTKQQAANRYRRSSQQQPAPDRYKEIQQALADKGYFGGAADGTWGPTSVDALKRFQHDQSLIEDGKLGSLSIIALGLGPKRGGTSVLAAPAHQPESFTDPELRADPPSTDPQ
jgi:hypothetical protein